MANDPWFKKVAALLPFDPPVTTGVGYDPYWANVVYLLHGNGVDGARVITDEKANAFATTTYLTKAIAGAYGGSAIYLDGTATTQYIYSTAACPTALGTDFTIEFRFMPAEMKTCYLYDGRTSVGNATAAPCLRMNADGSLYFVNYAQAGFSSAAGVVLLGTWCHIAMVRISGVMRVYVNGVLVITGAEVGTYAAGMRHSFGALIYNGTASVVKGYYNDIRITATVGRYTGAFTPPQRLLPHWGTPADTALFDSLYAAALVADRYSTNWKVTGTPTLSTTQSKWGGGSLYLTGSSTVYKPAVSFGTRDFTIEGWFYINAPSVQFSGRRDAQLLSLGDGLGNRLLQLNVTGDAANTGTGLALYDSYSGVATAGAATISNGAWHHAAVSRAAGVLRAFLDGNKVAETANTASIGSAATWLVLGGEPSGSKNGKWGIGAALAWSAPVWNGTVFCMVASGTNQSATSPDGRVWTVRNNMPVVSGWTQIAWNGTTYCAISSTVGTVAATSPDGVTWTAQTLSASATWRIIYWSARIGKFIVFSTALPTSTSPDGVTWTAGAVPSAGDVLCAYDAFGYLIINLYNNGRFIYSSSDGVSWAFAGSTFGSIYRAANNGTIVIHPQSVSSATLIGHTNLSTIVSNGTYAVPVAAIYDDIMWTGSLFVITSQASQLIYTSPTGLAGSWTQVAWNFPVKWLAFNGQAIVGVNSSTGFAGTMDLINPQFSNMYLDGYLDDWRVTDGVGRYTANFSVPDGSYATAPTGVSGVVKESDGTPRACKVFAYSHATGALLGSAVSDAGTGAFYIAAPERCYCVCLDDDANARNAIVYDRLDPV